MVRYNHSEIGIPNGFLATLCGAKVVAQTNSVYTALRGIMDGERGAFSVIVKSSHSFALDNLHLNCKLTQCSDPIT